MTRRTRLVLLSPLAALAASLGACITVFPKPEAVEMYRFETQPGQTRPAASTPAQNVLATQGSFSSEAAGDRLVAVSDGQVAYVRGVRWVAPAEDLFKNAVDQTFRARRGPTYLSQRGGPARAAYLLRYDVNRFELRYPSAPGAAPAVFVAIYATLTRAKDRTVVAGNEFDANVPVAENRFSMFPTAYDRALDEAIGDMADWVDRSVQAGS